MNIEIGNKKIDFVYQGDNLIYPNYPARENLILHYDFSGMKNSDVTKAIAEDLSGNGNNGVLQNFAYTNESGYLDNALIFDGIDDFITIPKPLIDLNNFTYSEGINVLSFRGDEVATVVDGVVEIGGRNLIIQRDLVEGYIAGDGRYPLGEPHTGSVPNNNITTGFIDVSGFDSITLTLFEDVPNPGGIARMYAYDEQKNPLRLLFTQTSSTFTQKNSTIKIEIGADVKYIAATLMKVNVLRYKIKRGNEATNWTPAPEDLEITTTFKPFFDKKIKSALYWNRALTDEELLQVYNTQIKRA